MFINVSDGYEWKFSAWCLIFQPIQLDPAIQHPAKIVKLDKTNLVKLLSFRIADHVPRGFPMASPYETCRVETMNKIDIAMVPHVVHGFNTT